MWRIIAIVVLLMPIEAAATEIPRYDVDSYCNEIGEVSGGSSVIVNTCVEMEQEAYDGLRANWQDFSAQAKGYCDEVAQVTGGSYVILESCLEMEDEAESAPRGFQP